VLGCDITGAGVILSVTWGGGAEGSVAVLPQQFPMRRYEALDDDGARFKREHERGGGEVGKEVNGLLSGSSWCEEHLPVSWLRRHQSPENAVSA